MKSRNISGNVEIRRFFCQISISHKMKEWRQLFINGLKVEDVWMGVFGECRINGFII